jgi:hypothetical protein
MPELKKSDFIDGGQLKTASGGAYSGKTRIAIFGEKMKAKKQFVIGASSSGKKVYGFALLGKDGKIPGKQNFPYTFIYSTDRNAPSKKRETIAVTKVFKDEDMGGGGSRAKQSDNTGPTESGCAYYCSLIFNIVKRPLKISDCTDTNLKKAAKFVRATSTYEQFKKDGPQDWVDENVYMNTANAVWREFGGKFKGTVYCHRGSPFMKSLYDAFKAAKKWDQSSEGDNLTPGSLNDDKWNPGDIWLSTFTPESKPLKNCKTYADLRNCVLEYAGKDGTGGDTKLLAVSLKKPGNKNRAVTREFNTATRSNYKKGTVKFEGFSYGKKGDFFSSNDVYIRVAGKDVQFRAFNTNKSWQGNIIGTGALGGKIGGGNIDYYLREAGLGTVSASDGGSYREVVDSMLKQKDYTLLYKLYRKYVNKQRIPNPAIEYKNEQDFEEARLEEAPNFTWQKLMSMRMIDLLMEGSLNKRNQFALNLVRYAASNTELSTYFLKVE